MRRRHLGILVVAGAIGAFGAMNAFGHGGNPNFIHACVGPNGHVLIVSPTNDCHTIFPFGHWKPLDWSITGPSGPSGPKGTTGASGPSGPSGPAADRALITGFLTNTSSMNANAVDKSLSRAAGDVLSNAIPVVMDRAGSVVGISVACTEARTAGTATFNVFINGVNTNFGVQLNAGTTNKHFAVQAAGADAFAADAELDVRQTNVGWAPTTSDCEAVVTVQYS